MIALLTNTAFRAVACLAGLYVVVWLVHAHAVARTTGRLQRAHETAERIAYLQGIADGERRVLDRRKRVLTRTRPFDFEADR